MNNIDEPNWPQILQAVQDQLQARIHTSLPGRVVTYDTPTQTATVQLVVQLKDQKIPPLEDVPVLWPGGADGHLHVPLAAGDNVMVLFSEEDFARWWDTGSISNPVLLQRHGLHAVAIPGLSRAKAPLDVTAGHATLAATNELRLGADDASDYVALKSLVESAMSSIFDAVIAAGGSITPTGGGPAFVTAMNTQKTTFLASLNVGATKTKAK